MRHRHPCTPPPPFPAAPPTPDRTESECTSASTGAFAMAGGAVSVSRHPPARMPPAAPAPDPLPFGSLGKLARRCAPLRRPRTGTLGADRMVGRSCHQVRNLGRSGQPATYSSHLLHSSTRTDREAGTPSCTSRAIASRFMLIPLVRLSDGEDAVYFRCYAFHKTFLCRAIHHEGLSALEARERVGSIRR